MTQKFTHIFNPTILREYDIRGIVGKTLHESDLYAVGRVFGTKIIRDGGKKAGLCYDGRHSSPAFADALVRGLVDCGVIVENFGPGPTPMAYFGLYHRELDAAIAITGSHNPPDYNGIKMATKNGPVYGATITDMGRMAANGDVVSGTGSVMGVDIYDAYVQRLVSDYRDNGKKPLTVVWDAGNGIVGQVLKKFTDALPGKHILLFDDVDGNFPNHHPDPTIEKNLVDLKAAVAKHGADVGIGFDGDGDRIGAVDAQGNVVWGDQLLALYARDILARKPGATIVLDVKCSKTAADMIAQWGGKPVLWKAGHSLVKAKMMETGAVLGGELSGHIFFKDGFYGHDDALYCAVRLLNVIQQYGALSDLRALFPPVFNTPEIRFDVPEEDKFAIIDRAKNYVRQSGGDILDIDGIRVNTPNGWWLLRASNTQNALTARVEATSAPALHDLVGSLKTALRAANCIFPDPLY